MNPQLLNILKTNNKIFFISGKKSFYESGAFKIFKKNIKNNIYFKKNKYPDFVELKRIIKIVENFKPRVIIGIGGGCVIDYAKLCSCIDNKEISKIGDKDLILKNKYKVIAIPTTAGSGAEVTPNAVLYKKKIKLSIHSKELRPKKIFYIPKLLFKLENIAKTSSAFDAICQSIEAILSKKSTKISDKFAFKSLKIIKKNIMKYFETPNFNNCMLMLKGANYSGRAISISETTAAHACSYPFTSYYNIPHGHAVMMLTKEFLKYNYSFSDKNHKIKLKYQKIFKALNIKNILQLMNFIDNIKKLSKFKYNIKKNKISLNKIIKGINYRRLQNNPVKINRKDLIKIIKTSVNGLPKN